MIPCTAKAPSFWFCNIGGDLKGDESAPNVAPSRTNRCMSPGTLQFLVSKQILRELSSRL